MFAWACAFIQIVIFKLTFEERRVTCISRSEWVSNEIFGHILAALTEENRLAVITSLVTGLRIGDVLCLRSRELRQDRITVTEHKTLKRRTVRVPKKLRDQLLSIAGYIYVFEHRTDPRRHRTRQAVYKDIVRARKAFRISEHITPHSARKIYAVAEYKKDCDIRRVRKLLNHSDEAITMLYALADELTARAHRPHTKKPP